MEMATVRVSPGILPPTIRTTPNSPRVCANVITAAERTPGQASGSSMRIRACQKPSPQQRVASWMSGEIDSKARCMGCTANGMLKTTEATTRPVKLKASVPPVIASNQRPRGDCPPMATSR
jgi:hypothetical protein